MPANNRRVIALILMLSFCAPARAQGDEEVVKVDTALVTVNVSVADAKGRHLPEFQAQDFLVTDQGQPVRLEFFDSQGPASVVFVIDTSASMKNEKWKQLRAGIKKFLAKAHEGNDYTLVAFGDYPRLVTRSAGAAELWQCFLGLEPAGNTALYDALLLGLEALGRTPSQHKALVLLSDGQDNHSRARLSDVQREALARRATIYGVGILTFQNSRGSYLSDVERSGMEILRRLTADTGGLVSFPDPDGIGGVLEGINADVSNQYTLGYYAPDATPGWRNIQVAVNPGPRRLSLRYQQRYLKR